MKNYENIKSNWQQKLQNKAFPNSENLPAALMTITELLSEEMADLYQKSHRNQAELVQKVTQNIRSKSISRTQPSHAIVQIQPKEEVETIALNDTFEISTSQHHSLEKVYFSVAEKSTVTPVSIPFLINSKGVFTNENGVKWQFKEYIESNIVAENEFFVGLAMRDNLDDWLDFTLFFNWENQSAFSNFDLAKIMNNVRVEIGETSFLLETKRKKQSDFSNLRADWQEYFYMDNIRENVADYYKNHFLKLPKKAVSHLKKGNPQFSDVLKNISVPTAEMRWLKIVFPTALPASFKENPAVFTNCFPVLNQKQNIREESLNKTLPIVPLFDRNRKKVAQKTDYFLGLEKVFSAQKNYKPRLTKSSTTALDDTYFLQKGVIGTEQIFLVKQQIVETIELLKTEADLCQKVFSYTQNSNDIIATLKTIQEKVMELEQHLDSNISAEPDYFLELFSSEEKEHVFVYYWITQGERVAGLEIAEAAFMSKNWEGNFLTNFKK